VSLALSAAGVPNTQNSEVRAAPQNSLQDATGAEGDSEEEEKSLEEQAAEAAQAKAAEAKAKAKAKAKGKGKGKGSGTDPENPPPNRKPADPQVVLLSQAKDVKQQRSNVLGACAEIKNLTATHKEWQFAATPVEVATLQAAMDKLQVSNLV
jgi:hypothetical protein